MDQRLMQKKGAALWISVVLYFGIGIVILTIILTAGLPVINKLRDKNVVIQTKEVMHTLDENIREVIKEGPGSQRVVTVNVKKGTIDIEPQTRKITWKYEGAKIPISEPNTPNPDDPELEVPEGKLIVRTDNGAQDGTYDISIILKYDDIPAEITNERNIRALVGLSDLVIRNNGLVPDLSTSDLNDQIIQVSISQTNA